MRWIRANVGDLDPDRSAVGFCSLPGALLGVHSLIDCPIDIEHELHGEMTLVVKRAEAAPRNARNVIVIDELIDAFLKRGQIPPAAADTLEGLGVNLALANAITVGRGDLRHLLARVLKVGH